MKEKIGENILIEISRDGMKAYMTMFSEEDSDEKSQENIDTIINNIKKIINYGLKENIVKTMIENKIYDQKICIAEGKPPKPEKDGYIKMYFNKNKKLSPKINKDGSVDYKNLDLIDNVEKGDVLAEIFLPKGGEIGFSVTGEEIPFKKGKIPILKQGKNVEVTDDGMKFSAVKDGMVKLLNKKISVLDILEVPAVDNSTGNVDFNGSVIVKGDIVNGFQLRGDGDIEVNGVVEGAVIESNGDILIRQGIQGYSKAKIYAKGKLTTQFIENSSVEAEDAIIADAIMHSDLKSHDSINAIGKRGLIVGGICRAKNEINAKTVGSNMATSTILEVGVDPSIKLKYEVLKENIESSKGNIEKVKKTIELLENMMKTKNLDETKKQLYKKLILTRDTIQTQLIKLNKEFFIIENQIKNLSSGKVRVEGIVHPGVKIIIGNESMLINDSLDYCSFYVEDGEIKIGPY